jgi:enterobactin synthetase component D
VISSAAPSSPASIQRSVAKRQAEFLAGRLCARAALQRLDGWTASRPSAKTVPRSGQAYRWLITHSTGHAAAIVGHKASGAGWAWTWKTCCLERAERLAGEILTADELQRMGRCPRAHALLVTLTFSVKESLFKALYPIVGKALLL